MIPPRPGDSESHLPLTPRMTLHTPGQWRVDASVAPPAATLGGRPAASVTAPLTEFTPAEPPIALEVRRAPAAVLSAPGQPTALSLTYTPTEDAAYVLLQEIHTSDGLIYDFTLPTRRSAPPVAVLGAESPPATLEFPINPSVLGEAPPAAALGLEDVVTDIVGDLVIGRVLQVLKSPLDKALLQTVRQSEPQPRVLVQRDTLQPLDGFDAWRALLPPGQEHRVLLLLHGFGSSTARTGARLLPIFVPKYDAVLGYDHPTLTADPLENARDLLARVPDDLRLSVDIVAHSRGGLVARSLVELIEPSERWVPRHLITNGSPHNGTRLADPERWDRLVSLGMTAASWLAPTLGIAFWIPKVLELVLKAAAQSTFSLPGIAAMTPGNPFLQQLNASADSATAIDARQRQVQYSAVSSAFSVFSVPQPSFQQAFRALAAQAFIDEANDLVVPTSSMQAIDLPFSLVPPERQFKATVDHFSYFDNPQVLAFVRSQLA